jgi:hypothetical protein
LSLAESLDAVLLLLDADTRRGQSLGL